MQFSRPSKEEIEIRTSEPLDIPNFNEMRRPTSTSKETILTRRKRAQNVFALSLSNKHLAPPNEIMRSSDPYEKHEGDDYKKAGVINGFLAKPLMIKVLH